MTSRKPSSGSRNAKPILSVVMPVHEGSEWVAATLESLVVQQTDGLEIILIDSSPTDTTSKIIEGYSERLPMRPIRRTDLKPWQAKTNFAVELASADHVCMLHQDDLWLPGRVEAVRRWIAQAHGATLHLAPALIIDRRGRRIGRWSCPLPAEHSLATEFVLERLLIQNFVPLPAPVFTRRAYLAVGGLDETLWYTADWDLWAKLAGVGPVYYHDDATTAFRVHGKSLTMTGSRDRCDFRSQMQIVLDRHLHQLGDTTRRRIEPAAQTSINVNVSLAAASDGNRKALFDAARNILSLGPAGTMRYLRDSRLTDRVLPRVRAKMARAF